MGSSLEPLLDAGFRHLVKGIQELHLKAARSGCIGTGHLACNAHDRHGVSRRLKQVRIDCGKRPAQADAVHPRPVTRGIMA